MRRGSIVLLVSLALVASPLRARADDCWECAATFALGFVLPLFVTTAAEVAYAASHDLPPWRAPIEAPAASWVPVERPPPEAPPPPARIPDDPRVGEVRSAPSVDPARSAAEELLSRGEYFKAAEAYRALALERPGIPEIDLRFAEALLGSGNHRYADHILRRALRGRLDPGTLQARSPAALFSGKLAALEKKIAASSDPASLRLLAAYAAAASGDPARAETHLAALLRKNPGDAEALRLKG